MFETFILRAARSSVANFRGFLISRIPKHYSPSFFFDEALIYYSRFLGIYSRVAKTLNLFKVS